MTKGATTVPGSSPKEVGLSHFSQSNAFRRLAVGAALSDEQAVETYGLPLSCEVGQSLGPLLGCNELPDECSTLRWNI